MHIQLKINGYEILSSQDITTDAQRGGVSEVLFQAACFFLALKVGNEGQEQAI